MASGTLKLKQKRSQERRQKIVAAATRLFGRQGIAQTSLTEVARAAGMPLTSLYDYFKDKQDLVAAVPEANYLALYAQLTSDATAADPGRQLRGIFIANLRYIRDNPDWGRVFFLEIWPSAAIGEARIRRAVDRYGLRYVELIRGAIASGAYDRKLDPYLAMSMLMGGMCHLTAVWLLYRRPYDLVDRGSALFDRLERAFLANPEGKGAGAKLARRGLSHQALDELKRSIALAVVRRFTPFEIRARILTNLHRWRRRGSWVSAHDEWRGIAERGDDGELFVAMLGRDDDATRLRQSMPFVGLLSQEEVRRLHEEATGKP